MALAPAHGGDPHARRRALTALIGVGSSVVVDAADVVDSADIADLIDAIGAVEVSR